MKGNRCPKPWILGLVFLLILVPIGSVYAQKASTLPSRVTFAAGVPTSLAYQYAAGLSKVATAHTPMLVVAQSTAGPAAYVKQISDTGKPEFGWMGGVDTWQAYVGKFVKEPVPGLPKVDPPYPLSRNIRIVVATPAMALGFIARNDSPFKKVADLKGKRVSWEFAGYAPNVASVLCYMTVGGLTIEDVIPVPVSGLKAGVDALVEGRLDATTSSVGMPATTEANAKVGVHHLEQNVAGPEWLRKAEIIHPGSYVATCPAGAGASVRVDTPLWYKPSYVISSVQVSDEVVYTLLKALWDHHQETWGMHRALKAFKPEKFIDNKFPIPVHTGAIKFYKEKGMWTPEREKRQQENLKM